MTGSSEANTELPDGYEGYTSETYADDAHWLCKPGIADDVCVGDLDATVVNANGSTEVEPHEVAADPAIDCFYVYPTTSRDPGVNSDLEPAENQEIVTVLNQVARLTSECRVFAPVYRQVTLNVIGGAEARAGREPPGDRLRRRPRRLPGLRRQRERRPRLRAHRPLAGRRPPHRADPPGDRRRARSCATGWWAPTSSGRR